jgi:PAS domain S-box-containing protein
MQLQSSLNIIINTMVDMLIVTDVNGNVLKVNEALIKNIGYTEEELLNRPMDILFEGERAHKIVERLVSATLENGSVEHEQVLRIRKKSKAITALISGARMDDDKGNPTGMVFIAHDITRRKKAEVAIKKKNVALNREIKEHKKTTEQLQLTQFNVDYAQEAIFTVNRESKLIYVNEATCKTLGYTREELLTMTVSDFNPNVPLSLWESNWEEIKVIKQIIVESVHKRKNGVRFPVSLSLKYHVYNDIEYVDAHAIDISEEKKIKKELKLFQFAIEHSATAVYWLNEQGYVIYANDYACTLLGYSPDEVFRLHVNKINPNLVQEDQLERWDELRKKEHYTTETEHTRKDRTVVPVEVSVNRITFYYKPYKCVFATDITERKKTEEAIKGYAKELENANQGLMKANDALDSFVYNVSHDLKSPVINMQSMITMLKQDISESGDNAEMIVDHMERSCNKFQQTINDFLEISRIEKKTNLENDEIELDTLLEEVLHDLDTMIKDTSAKIDSDFSNAPKVEFPMVNLTSIMSNLVSNALKYRSPDRVPHISISSKNGSDCTSISVKDNGIGIDMKKSGHKLFGMFNRLANHEGIDGTGVGLFMVKKIVENSGGKVEVVSTPGKGSEFLVHLKNKT